MKILFFLTGQLFQFSKGNLRPLTYKTKLVFTFILKILGYVLAIPFVLILRLIKPIVLVRIAGLISTRIGHFVGNTEIYLCEQEAGINKPKKKFIDFFYLEPEPICNKQVLKMWRRELKILPHVILAPIHRVNQNIPGGNLHMIQGIRSALDTNNLLDKYPSHLKLTSDEEALGEGLLLDMGIPFGKKFICLNVRDDAYLKTKFGYRDFSYHNYRNSDIQNYILAAEALAARGYYVVRMGAKVNASIKTKNVRIIDYATNGMRSDFMDVYLGVKCYFAISTGSGWDSIPEYARKPIVFVNFAPLGFVHTFLSKSITITKKYLSISDGSRLSISQIVSGGAALSLSTEAYEAKGIQLAENSPEEIRDVVIEMEERLNGTWIPQKDDEVLQQKFWNLFPVHAVDNGIPLHGKILSRYGTSFLRNNTEWLQ
jgi:putative glycosyltransferase (TIGR04372 family)